MTRPIAWSLAAIPGVIIAIALPWDEFRVFGGLLTVAVVGLVGEASRIARDLIGSKDDPPPRDGRPADGVVEVERVPGVIGTTQPADDRFRTVVGFGSVAPVPTQFRSTRHRPLLGKVAIVSIFIGRDGVGWSDSEIASSLKALVRAGEWIERQAIQHGAAVNVVLADAYLEGIDDRPRETSAIVIFEERFEAVPDEAEHDRLLRVAKNQLFAAIAHAVGRLELGSFVDVCRALQSRIAADAVVWLVHMRAAGRSEAIDEELCGVPGMNLAVCYASEDNFPGEIQSTPFPDPVTHIHELLHLFGATDKYGNSLRGMPRGEVTSRDVMRLDYNSLSRLRVDPLTAREIGWPPRIDPESNDPVRPARTRRKGG